jgi:hypothetical protein
LGGACEDRLGGRRPVGAVSTASHAAHISIAPDSSSEAHRYALKPDLPMWGDWRRSDVTSDYQNALIGLLRALGIE